ncbi:MAG: PAS domain S-box protein [Acidobacteria bacterium]|nr:PAS domain S-box protein [Acidobacteriota bacterium]
MDSAKNDAPTRHSARRFFNQSHTLMFVAGFDGQIIRLNPAWKTMLGFTPEEMMAYPFFHFVHPHDLKAVSTELQRLTCGVVTRTFELRALCKDGSYKWTLWNATPYPEEQVFYATGYDITRRKRAEEVLFETEHIYRKILDAIPDMVFCKDRQSQFTWGNKAFLEYYSFSDEEIATAGAETNQQELYRQQDAQVFSTGETLNILEEAARRYDGEPHLFNTVKSAITNCAGEVVMVVGVSRDITEQRRAAVEREALISELQEALAQVKTLKGLLPICASCKKIRDDQGDWHPVEIYINEHSGAEFSHGVCPDCFKNLYPDFVNLLPPTNNETEK